MLVDVQGVADDGGGALGAGGARRSAVRMAEAGHATAQDIAQSMYDEYKEPLYAPPPLLARMVEAGLLGRKSGRGFHSHRGA
ncbi:3-hydroxyacyl-CoA dehydrogenase [Kitasatospora gansuensis]|uniref:3-hydroxyacyl-CoA dehydrogenase n=1 Tax=Kitasatospora gansuensis TaxID=258050 RepID=A0A7W7SJ21_9ACTN|nr:3-hydroxyacyl-CoA dehydrogenase [Kitasatospora gansuensis]